MAASDPGFHRLIAASKVAGTPVLNAAGERLGTISDLMIDKTSGTIAFAVMRFGGFLGLGDRHHPLPWETLSFDPTSGAYVLSLARETLEAAPTLTEEGYAELQDPAWSAQLRRHFGIETD